METREFSTEDINIIIKAIDYGYTIIEEEHRDDLIQPLLAIKLKFKLADELGIGVFTKTDAEVTRSILCLYILNSLKENDNNEASKALSALNKLPE